MRDSSTAPAERTLSSRGLAAAGGEDAGQLDVAAAAGGEDTGWPDLGAAAERAPAPAPARRVARGFALWLGAVGLSGLLLFLYHYLAALAVREPRTPLAPFIEELTGAFVGGLLFFPIRWLARRLPLTARDWPRRLPVYLLSLPVFGFAATTLMWGLRSALFPLAGLGAYDYGVMPLRYLMELPLQVIWIGILVAAVHSGRFANLDEAAREMVRIAEVVEPRPETRAAYEEGYARHRATYPALRELMHR